MGGCAHRQERPNAACAGDQGGPVADSDSNQASGRSLHNDSSKRTLIAQSEDETMRVRLRFLNVLAQSSLAALDQGSSTATGLRDVSWNQSGGWVRGAG